ncbi:MAG: hypothetical protein ACOY3P_23975 [Planctomycetota bacterium]
METASEIIDRIKARETERAYLLDQLVGLVGEGSGPRDRPGHGARLLTEKQDRDFRRRMDAYIETLRSGRKRPPDDTGPDAESGLPL